VAMLVIEIDGEVHEDAYQKERDSERTKILKRLGIKEIRFKNKEVINNLENVITRIAAELKNHHQ
jgi:leucyl-tRNA synthetase